MIEELIEIVWRMAVILAIAYACLFLLALFVFAVKALCFYTGELMLSCVVRGYRIRKNPFNPEPLPEHKRLSENSFFVGLFFWAIVLILWFVFL